MLRRTACWKSARRRSLTLRQIVHPTPRASSETRRHDTASYGEVDTVDTVDATGTWDEGSGSQAVFLVNRHPADAVEVTIYLRAFSGWRRSGPAPRGCWP